MRRPRPTLLRAAIATLLLLPPAPPRAASADAPVKLTTQRVAIRPLDEPAREIELVRLPPGVITLTGADGKEHRHEVKPIWVARHEITWGQYHAFWALKDLTDRQIRENPNKLYAERTLPPFFPPWAGLDEDGQEWTSPDDPDYPANCVHFQAARRYCVWLSKHTRKKFRLPTEAEWEYACRAGGPPLTPDAKALDEVAWFAGNAKGRPHAVGQKRPNAWGLHDMLGNVGEFVVRDPRDDKGLLAGGSWRDDANGVHGGAREPYSRDWQKNDDQDPPSTSWLNWTVHHVGFRVVMED